MAVCLSSVGALLLAAAAPMLTLECKSLLLHAGSASRHASRHHAWHHTLLCLQAPRPASSAALTRGMGVMVAATAREASLWGCSHPAVSLAEGLQAAATPGARAACRRKGRETAAGSMAALGPGLAAQRWGGAARSAEVRNAAARLWSTR